LQMGASTASFVSPTALSVGTATNLAGGAAGSIAYQTGAGLSGFIGIGPNGYVLTSNGTTATWQASTGGAATAVDPIIVNDISPQFDGAKTVFALRQDQAGISSIVDSKDLEVVINGQRLAPYVDEYRWPWITPYDSYRGFRAVSVNSVTSVIIYNAPYMGDSALIVVRGTSSTRQKRRYPYSANSIALGD